MERNQVISMSLIFFKLIKPDISKELEGNISNFGSRLVTIKIYK